MRAGDLVRKIAPTPLPVLRLTKLALVRAYEAILPGSADRMLRMAEVEQLHRHKVENRDSRTDALLGLGGLACAFLIALLSDELDGEPFVRW